MLAVVQCSTEYSIDVIKKQALQLVKQGILDCQQPIYTLYQFIPAREWNCLECELERHDFLLRDRLIDLIGTETWQHDEINC